MTFVPCLALALLATVLCFAASATLGKLSRLRLPLAASRISALANTLPRVVLAAGVSHDDSCPVLYFQWVHGPVRELFDDGKNIGPRGCMKRRPQRRVL